LILALAKGQCQGEHEIRHSVFLPAPGRQGASVAEGTAARPEGHAAVAAFGCLILGPRKQIEEMLRPMNPNRISSLPGCAATRQGQGRRKPAALPRCTAGHNRPPQEDRPPRKSSWADAASASPAAPPAPAPPPADATTVRARASTRASTSATESSVAGQAGKLARNGRAPGPSGRLRGSAGTAWRPFRLVAAVNGWVSGYLAQAGDMVFARTDAEASWHAWDMERRHAGLGRCYRDPRFDTLVSCLRCHDISTTTGRPVCGPCSAAEHLIPV
jgi:hypothetical protein